MINNNISRRDMFKAGIKKQYPNKQRPIHLLINDKKNKHVLHLSYFLNIKDNIENGKTVRELKLENNVKKMDNMRIKKEYDIIISLVNFGWTEEKAEKYAMSTRDPNIKLRKRRNKQKSLYKNTI